MDETEFSIYECKKCDNVILSNNDAAEMKCCGGKPRNVREIDAEIEKPSQKGLLKEVFDLTETGMEICLCVMEEGESTVSDISESIDVDRSAVSRYVNNLVDIGMLKKDVRNLEKGGYVHIYSHEPPEKVKKNLTMGFYKWTALGVKRINELNAQKMEAMADKDESMSVGEKLRNKIFYDKDD
ncbi:MAG: helix-turn-helix domain-containing protein [Halobacteria archaeon]